MRGRRTVFRARMHRGLTVFVAAWPSSGITTAQKLGLLAAAIIWATPVYAMGSISDLFTGSVSFKINAHAEIKVSQERVLPAGSVPVRVTWTPDGSMIIAATTWGGELQAWDKSGSQVGAVVRAGNRMTSQIAAVGSKGLVAFPIAEDGGDDVYLNVWDVLNNRLVKKLTPEYKDNKGIISEFSIASNGSLLAIQVGATEGGHRYGTIVAYDTATWKRLRTIKLPSDHHEMVGFDSIVFVPNGHKILGAGYDGSIYGVDLDSGVVTKLISPYATSFPDGASTSAVVYALAVSPDGSKYMAALGVGGIIDTSSDIAGKNVKSYKQYENEGNSWIKSVPELQIWKTSDNSFVAAYPDRGITTVRASAWDPLDRFIAFTDSERNLLLWQPNAIDSKATEIDLPDTASSIAFDPTGDHLAVTTNSSIIVFRITQVGEE